MPRKKKRKRSRQKVKTQKKGVELFNPAFADLTLIKKEDKKIPQGTYRPERPGNSRERDEARRFLEAMSDVEPILENRSRIAKRPNPGVRPAHPVRNDETEAMAHLSDIVSGAAEIDITFTDEYIQGSVQGFSRKLMQKLKKGQFPVQDYVDLHGLTKEAAEIKVRDFLIHSQGRGLRCVLVVHGRGLNSENHIPVLKEQLPLWLSRGPVRKMVLAFATARPYDGGTGAIYILLRTRRLHRP
ncbi:MAG: DNA mismatch repair protein MutS, partial [Deltaproteobacteria bacterium]|nr:DNA mismatch repair protein MutS [Deltaproteobacteria bacterium]